MKSLIRAQNRRDIICAILYIIAIFLILFTLKVHDILLENARRNMEASYIYIQPITFCFIGFVLYLAIRLMKQINSYYEIFIINTVIIGYLMWNFSPWSIFGSPLTKHVEVLSIFLGILIIIQIQTTNIYGVLMNRIQRYLGNAKEMQ